ncbi:methyl-accepting chemotaxis protein [Vitreimonas flagellata]|uniref:methyl-accepting chemotaxis protein n=1 Tax=Vitreimonas flagellata TaxID=2560861 RepID=UPI00107518F8|nr:methyl-accepting chemotaxis protein [Vitreimonas flagellata]
MSTLDRKSDPGAGMSVFAFVVAGLWIVGAGVAAFALMGADRVQSLTLVEGAAIGAAVLFPALMAIFAGVAARDSARARAEAQRLADAADRLLNPERSAEDAARQLAMTVRGEISTLDQALEKTLARLQDVEGQIARQAQAVDNMADQARAGAGQMISGMEREREELLRISKELTNHAQTIGDSISRHTHSISEAARVAEAEVRAADQALDHRLTSFGAAAALISDRTHGLSSAAQASADSALRLEQALSNALDILAKATNLTDAARQSAEAATLAANSTAGAVRDTTHRAIDDAKRAADLIRNEAVNVEREAAVALERLRDAADAARSAAIGAREAVEDEAPQPARPRVRRRTPEAQDSAYDNSWRDEPDPLDAPPPRARRDDALFGERQERPIERPRQDSTPADWTWRDLLSNVEEGATPQSPAVRGAPAEDPVAHLRRRITQPRTASPALPIIETIEQSGLRMDDVFSPSALERIAQRSRGGTQARRRAVRDAAPDATHRLADFLTRDAHANQEAMLFLRNEGMRIAELIGRGRAAMNAEATRAFLLIDAAAG